MMCCWCNDRCNSIEESSIKTLITGPHIYGHFIYDEDRTKIVVFSVNCAGLIGYSWGKMKFDLLFLPYANINSSIKEK